MAIPGAPSKKPNETRPDYPQSSDAQAGRFGYLLSPPPCENDFE
jgi:hypothetical protein